MFGITMMSDLSPTTIPDDSKRLLSQAVEDVALKGEGVGNSQLLSSIKGVAAHAGRRKALYIPTRTAHLFDM